RMKRLDALEAVYPHLEDRVVVTIMGAVAAELQSIGHRANFFYLQHAMGLASSMGLGIALTRPDRQVIVLDGDGSVLMNLGGLTTLARYRPRNLVHVVFDNESLLSVGGFPTATSTATDLAAGDLVPIPIGGQLGDVGAPPGAAEAAGEKHLRVDANPGAQAAEPHTAREIAPAGEQPQRSAIELRAHGKAELETICAWFDRLQHSAPEQFERR